MILCRFASMETAVSKAYPALLDQAAQLQEEMAALQEKVNGLVRTAKSLIIVLPELHDKASGRINAQKVADFMGVPLKRLAEALDMNYKAVHRNPSAESFQPALQPVKRILQLLYEFFPKPESIRIWINTPHPELNGQTALEAILAKKSKAVLIILENAAAGIPV